MGPNPARVLNVHERTTVGAVVCVFSVLSARRKPVRETAKPKMPLETSVLHGRGRRRGFFRRQECPRYIRQRRRRMCDRIPDLSALPSRPWGASTRPVRPAVGEQSRLIAHNQAGTGVAFASVTGANQEAMPHQRLV